jgi:phage terminase Nu1 subunit (DNA packaging protein)
MTDSPRAHVNEHRPARGYDREQGKQIGEEEQGKGREDKWDVRRQRKRWCAHDAKCPRGRAIATTRVRRIREEAHAPTLSAKDGVARRWRHEGREKRSRMTNEVVTTEARTIIIVWRYRWPNGPCLASRPETRFI